MSPEVLIAMFDHEDRLLEATRAARKRGYRVRDAYTPFPVHGLDEAMGLPPSRLAVACFLFGSLGGCLALGFQLWVTTVSWPVNIGGKSENALPALAPITFEVIVLFAALGTVICFLARSKLWPGREPELPAAGITDDRFVLVLEAVPSGPGAVEAREMLTAVGAIAVEAPEVHR